MTTDSFINELYATANDGFVHLKPSRAVFLCTLGLIAGACDSSFDPRAKLEPTLVVFSVLSTDRSEQFVRVEQIYMPPDYNAVAYTVDEAVPSATVTISDEAGTSVLADTVFARVDTSRYRFPIQSFVLRSFTPLPGRAYTVTATSAEHGIARGSVTVPSRASLNAGSLTLALLDDPVRFDEKSYLSFSAVLSSSTRGYIGRLYVCYDVLKGTEWVEERVEIPPEFLFPDLEDLRFARYPGLMANPPHNQTSAVFGKKLYEKVLAQIAGDRYRGRKIIFKWTVFQLTQVDKNLYSYYQSVHAESDPHSIRLDLPAFTNVSGGHGVIGAYTLDSLIHVLPENFAFNNK